MNYSLSNSLTNFASEKAVISGFAYPLETLTSTRVKQWTVDGVPVGSPSTTFQVPLLAIGSVVRCGNSAPVTVWHPNQIAAVASFWMAAQNAFNAINPDTLATDGQTVRRWNGIISSTQANQTNSINQPIYRATGQSGNPSIEFDGSNDFFALPSNSDVFQNKSQAYIIAGVRETNPTAGDSTHIVCQYGINSGAGSRLGLCSRRGGNNFQAIARRNDGDTLTVAQAANDNAYHVLGAHGDFSNGFVRLMVDGSVVSSTALSGGSGSTSNTTSASAGIGQDNAGNSNHLSGHATAVCVVNASLTASELSQINRYIGLLGGLTTIPLV